MLMLRTGGGGLYTVSKEKKGNIFKKGQTYRYNKQPLKQ